PHRLGVGPDDSAVRDDRGVRVALLASRMRKRRRHPLAFLTAIGLGLFVPFGWLIAHLPAGAGLWAGRRFGDLLWMAPPPRRALALGNLARAFGDEYPDGARRRLGPESFEHLGMNLVEACRFLFRAPAPPVA